jgi:hypothetical protein
MDKDAVKARLRDWLVRVFAQAIGKVSNEHDRQDIAAWLERSREVLASDHPKTDKMRELYALTDTKAAAKVVARSVGEAVRNYKSADLPLAMKLAIPATLLAAPFVGGQGAGLAALGGALGLPVLLLVFLGTAGITSVLETFAGHGDGAPYVIGVLELIARDEVARRASAALKAAMKDEPVEAKRAAMPADEVKLRQKLLSMDPFEFERHVVSFFKVDGMLAWVTRKSNDLGVDGFVERGDDLFVIQCKHFTSGNVGGPDVQQFKGVIEENGASRGYLVTTTGFTSAARDSAAKSNRLVLVDMDDLVIWHAAPPIW